MMLNRITFAGNVGSDVEPNERRNGERAVNVRVCYTDRGRTGDVPVWVTVQCYGTVAEHAALAHKGDNVVVEGRLTTRVASDTGNEVTEIIASSIGIINRPKATMPRTGQRRVHYPQSEAGK